MRKRSETRRPADGLVLGYLAVDSEWPGRPGKDGDANYSVGRSLLIGECGCGTFHRLVVTGRNAGQVWHDDPDWGGLTPGPDFRDWYPGWLATP